MVEEILATGTLIVAIGTIGALFIHWYYYQRQNEIAKKNINFLAMLEIMKIFNDPKAANERHIVYSAYKDNSLYDSTSCCLIGGKKSCRKTLRIKIDEP